MPNNSCMWSVEEDQMIRKLKQEQILNNHTDWEILAEMRSPKQYRERYINYVKFDKENPLSLEWSEEQQEMLMNLYFEKGPAWSQISTFLKTKSQNLIKNKFNHSLKKATKILNEHKTKTNRKIHSIKQNTLFVLLRTSKEIMEIVKLVGHQINYDCSIFKFRDNLVKLCFKKQLFSESDIMEMIELIPTITTKLKSFHMFKAAVKNKKKQSIVSEKAINLITQINTVTKQKIIKIEEKPETLIKFEPQPIEQQVWTPLYSPQYLQCYGYCPCYQCMYNLSTHVKIQE